jgi:hypothetical protein
MSVLNVTYNGQSADLPAEIDAGLGDDDIRRIAVEIVRAGDLPGLHIPDLAEGAFADFVVDRFDTREGGRRIYLRPKVPFGTGL